MDRVFDGPSFRPVARGSQRMPFDVMGTPDSLVREAARQRQEPVVGGTADGPASALTPDA